MAGDPIDDAVAEANRRRGISDRDVTASVEHFRAVVRRVCQDWKLVVDGWLGGGSGIPPLTVRRTGGGAAVLKIAEPGSLDGPARVMSAAAGHGYARVLQWDADRGALLMERLGHDLWAEEPTVAGQARVLVWRWAFVERVTTGLYLRWFNDDETAESFLDAATVLLPAT
jgi:streptomycin 6-kinase